MIDASWILKNFSLQSISFTSFLKNCQNLDDSLFYKTAFDNWKKKFSLKFMITNNSHLGSYNDISSEKDVFIRYSYAAWVIYKISTIINIDFKFPEKIWQFFEWFSKLEPNLTAIYQKNIIELLELNKPLKISTEDLFGVFLNHVLERDIQEEKGMFYTPDILAHFLSTQVIKIQNLHPQSNILDPTCGTGNILIGLLHNIEASPLSPQIKRKFYQQIYGFDENPVAILATITNLSNNLLQLDYDIEIITKIAKNFRCLDVFTFFQLEENHEFFRFFDLVIGNLPWNVFNNIQNTTVKSQIERIGKHYDLFMTWKNRSNLEVSTVLFEIIHQNLLSSRGTICFLVPASLLTASQHSKFRRFNGLKNINVFHIKPDFFPIHSIILYAENSTVNLKKNKKFITQDIIANYYELDNSSKEWHLINEQIETPSYVSAHRGKVLVGKYYSKEINEDMIPIRKSYYFSKVYRGIDITPRRLLFIICKKDNESCIDDSDLIKITPDLSQISSTQSSTWNFIPYKSAIIEQSEVRLVVKSTDLIPYHLYNSHIAFLPLTIIDGHYKLKKPDNLPPNAQNHLYLLESIYKSHRKQNSKNRTLYESLSYGKKLINPKLLSPLKVIYPVGGSYCKAALLRNDEILIDVTFYYLTPNSEDEAYYLLGWLNSNLLNRNIPRVSTIGANGSIRVIHMAPWMFPIPKFTNSELQLKIVKISRFLENYVNGLYRKKLNLEIKKKSNVNENYIGKNLSLSKIYKILKKDRIYNENLNELDNLLHLLFE
ncbi:N-6 DNA methylase [Promethearchaeum syntrophicum]|uniref:site-specific DNA-methyltransferase (adenine-specific) n=1 Tax=Promethearchaeum syntrophicum TaxID=2594042 RepID=A0A5B9DDW3_9ARCH|nr:N-6 DNA methylase [Candidatus Prometheoarchaeum syntrophicum]QEE16916.1 N-6 DNA Methylase [Candidatus Prometheoarchaeum syntrophicum]